MKLPCPAPTVRLSTLALALAVGLSACSTVDSLLSGDKIDYRSAARKTVALEVPPDLTQLGNEGRYPVQSGAVSASTLPATGVATAPAATQVVAPAAIDDFRIERAGNQRWLSVPLRPEQLWPKLRAFWEERGFTIAIDSPEAGVMETEWAENRAKIPADFIRGLIGRVMDPLYSTSERDKFRVRVERTGGGSEVYISHRGMEEVYNSTLKESTIWQPRAADPQLEGEFLARLLVKLGAKEETARAAVANAAEAPPRARALAGAVATSVEIDEPFDRAWRRVGLALDRGGFTVEDRDRAAGVYFVRYIDPKTAGKDEPGFFSKLFGRDARTDGGTARYRIQVKGDSRKTVVSVQSAQGAPETGDIGQRIASLLVAELR